MSSLTKFEQEAFQLNDQTINSIKNLLQNRSSRTDKSIVNDFEKMMIQYRDAKNWKDEKRHGKVVSECVNTVNLATAGR